MQRQLLAAKLADRHLQLASCPLHVRLSTPVPLNLWFSVCLLSFCCSFSRLFLLTEARVLILGCFLYQCVHGCVCVWCGEMQPDRNPALRCKCVLTPSHLSKQFSQLQYDVWEQAGVGLLCRPVTEYERKSKTGKKKETQEMLQWAALHLWVVITNKLFPPFCVISPHPVIVQRVGFPKDYADPCTSHVLERHPQTPLGWRNHLCLLFAFESSNVDCPY